MDTALTNTAKVLKNIEDSRAVDSVMELAKEYGMEDPEYTILMIVAEHLKGTIEEFNPEN